MEPLAQKRGHALTAAPNWISRACAMETSTLVIASA